MSVTLQQIVSIATRSLEAEDKTIRLLKVTAGGEQNAREPGILHLLNERYYQFVVGRAMFALPDVIVQFEYKRSDLALLNKRKERLATVEMKRWMSDSGELELGGIKSDIIKLGRIAGGLRVMMLFGTCPVGSVETQRLWLRDNVDESLSEWAVDWFTTWDQRNVQCEFLVAGREI